MSNLRVRVYVVLEHHHGKHDAVIHGVYSSRRIAENKAADLLSNTKHGYICVLKKTVIGPSIEYVKPNRTKEQTYRIRSRLQKELNDFDSLMY